MTEEEKDLTEAPQIEEEELTDDDKLWSALGYPIPFLPIIALLMEEKRARPFIKFHAVQSLTLNVVLWVIFFILTVITLGLGSLCAPIFWLVTLWPAYEAYQGKRLELPLITKFITDQGWVD
jgi:uncharacterized membrane protein